MTDQRRGYVDGRDDAGRYHHLIEHIGDAVVEFDLQEGEPIVRDVNNAFVDVFGYERNALRGDSLNEWIVPEWLADEADRLDERTASGEVNYRRVRRETADGLREFLYRGVPYEEGVSADGGFAVYTDLTEITRSERRLQVMNRVLRHNLRNRATVITGTTTRLLAEFDEQTPERTSAAATLEDAAADLVALTEEAGDINRILDGSDAGDVVDCVPIVRDVVAEHSERSPRAAVETVLPESLQVQAGAHLRAAVDSLVDNAIEHNPADEPRVRVRVAPADADGWATISVDDDGPTIPPGERRVLTDDADITQMQHGTGLGLWIVKWATESCGGELFFESSDLGGNSVRIRLPRE
jgi:PAS domain S-box-containing protein